MVSWKRWLIIVLIVYLGGTFLADFGVNYLYRYRLIGRLNTLGSYHFAETTKLESWLKDDPQLRGYKLFLEFTPPFGFFHLASIEHLDDVIIYASKNIALPEAQRLSNPDEAKKYGFDPGAKADRAIAHAMFSQFF